MNLDAGIKKELMTLLNACFEKQELLISAEEEKTLSQFSLAETNCIDLVGKTDDQNVTALAKAMELSKSAVSRMIKKFRENGLVEGYQHEDNHKEIYYRLTDKGMNVYLAHRQSHDRWEEETGKYIDQIDATMVMIVNQFLTGYNECLEKKIEAMNEE